MVTQHDFFKYVLRTIEQSQLKDGFHLDTDPRGAGIVHNNRVELSDCQIVTGFIIETAVYAHAYKVLLNGNRTPLMCCALQTGGGNSVLSFDSSFYAPGTAVLVAVNPKALFGTILGAIPHPGDERDFTYSSLLSSASKDAPDISDYSCLNLQTDTNLVGMYQFGTGLPLDSTEIGEFGHITATGVKFMMNPYMALLSLDEYSGLWLFDADSLTRLSGINLQIRSTGRENEYLNDEGEYIEYKGSVLYPWEQLGYTRVPTEDIIIEPPEEEFIGEGKWRSFAEPAEDKVKPYHRIIDFGGWLGQGKYTQITAPDPEKKWNKYEESENHIGLFRKTETVDGYSNAVAAKSIFIGKRGLLPAVSRIARPDDTSTEIGDNSHNYHQNNKFEPAPEIPGNDKPMEKVMGLQDSIAYQQNYKELVPFIQHSKDYHVPEDSEINEGLSRFANFNELVNKQFTKVDSKKDVKILEGGEGIPSREIKVTAAESGIANLDDGSVVQFGGAGEEIRMSGGSIFMDAPGDLWFKSGRKIILWAGNDIEIRAKGHIDISTTEGSIRIKAENHLSMLGGNNESGGVLIESKGKTMDYDFSKPGEDAQFSGIMLKSANSTIATMGSTLYFRSGVEDSGSGIYFDAKEGEQGIYSLCSENVNYVEGAYTINYSNIKSGEVVATTYLSKDENMMSGSITVEKEGFFIGNVSTGQNYYAGGHIFTGDSSSYANYVADFENGKDKLRRALEEKEDVITTGYPSIYEEYYDIIKEFIYDDKRVGAEETRLQSGFTFRNPEQYKVPEDFAVFEARWQNIGSNADKGGIAWKEKPVVSNAVEDTYPFPGRDYFTTKTCYVTQAWTLTDYETGLYKNRKKEEEIADEYKNPKYGNQEIKSLNEYPVIG